MAHNYIDLLGAFYPGVEAHVPPGGNPEVYTDLVWSSSSISKVDLESHDITSVGEYLEPAILSEYQYEEDEGESSTTSGNWRTKVSIVTSSLPTGNYRVGWSYEWKLSDNKKYAGFRAVVDGTTVMEHVGAPAKKKIWEPASGFKSAIPLSGVVTLSLEFNNDKKKTTYVRRGRLEIWRVE